MSIEPYSIFLAALTAIASGMVGSFALMRRMTLAGDAFAHIALPGIGLALLYSYNPVLGGAITLLLGALIIWRVEKFSPLNTEAIVGVLFAISLAAGAIAITEEHELVETLFGNITPVTPSEVIFGSLIAAAVIGFIFKCRRALVLPLISKELAKTAAVPIEKLQLAFLVVFALAVMLGMKFLGVLLMGALIIIPAATARNLARNLSGMLFMASGAALAATLTGIFVSQIFIIQLGPAIIIIAGALFLVSFFPTALRVVRQ